MASGMDVTDQPGWEQRLQRAAAELRQACERDAAEAEAMLETVPRPAGCLCTWEFGDSACPVHPTCEGCGLPPGLCECE